MNVLRTMKVEEKAMFAYSVGHWSQHLLTISVTAEVVAMQPLIDLPFTFLFVIHLSNHLIQPHNECECHVQNDGSFTGRIGKLFKKPKELILY